MAWLATSSSVWMWGCLRPQVLPPRMTRTLVPSNRKVVVEPVIPAPSMVQTPPAALNPWKPDVTERDWQHIVIHHTGTDRGSVESIHDAHLKRKDKSGNSWLGIGYHFVIGNGHGMGDGEVQPTFRWKEQMQGAHAGVNKYNQQGIGIALIGNFDETTPSAAQLKAAKTLVAALKQAYSIPSERVVGHNEFRATACPGHNLPMDEIRQSTLLSQTQVPEVRYVRNDRFGNRINSTMSSPFLMPSTPTKGVRTSDAFPNQFATAGRMYSP